MVQGGNVEKTSFPVAYILLDCCHAERDNEFLQHAVHNIKEYMSDCELNFFAYKSPEELLQTCLNLTRSLNREGVSPVKLVWVSFNDFANLSEDCALAVLTLRDAINMSTQAQSRSILIRGGDENDISFQWSLLLNAISITTKDLSTIAHEKEWLVDTMEVDDQEYGVYCDPFMHFPKQSNHITRILGSVERSIAEPMGNFAAFEGRTLVLKSGDRLFYIQPTTADHYTISPIIECFSSCILKRLQPIVKTKRRTSVDSQASQTTRPKSSPKDCNEVQVEVKPIKEQNKAALKKLLLLSLRKAGISTSSKEFKDTWKHLYCGCVFALRKELDRVNIDQSTLISIIQANMRTFNIK